MNILLYDRTDGQDRLVTTTTGERMRNRGIFYRVRELEPRRFWSMIRNAGGFRQDRGADGRSDHAPR